MFFLIIKTKRPLFIFTTTGSQTVLVADDKQHLVNVYDRVSVCGEGTPTRTRPLVPEIPFTRQRSLEDRIDPP